MNTSDMYLAALLLAKHYNLEKVDRTDMRHIRFCFNGDKDSLDMVSQDFLNREAIVNAADFSDAIKKIKQVIYSS